MAAEPPGELFSAVRKFPFLELRPFLRELAPPCGGNRYNRL